MHLRDSLKSLGLAVGLTFVAGAAAAQTPCIDARPVEFSGYETVLTFHASDGRTITRYDLLLRNYDPARNMLTVEELLQNRSISLDEWKMLTVKLQRSQQMPVQTSIGPRTEMLKLENQKFSLRSMKVADGIISFGGCAVRSGAGRDAKVKFDGKLRFDTASDTLTVDGTYWEISPRSASSRNPGFEK